MPSSTPPRHSAPSNCGILVWSSDTELAPRLVKALGSLSGVVIECATSSEEVMAAALDDRVSVLVADLGTGGARTATALRNLKRVRPRLPIIVLAAEFNERFRSEVMPLGILCHLPHDFEREELIEAVRSAQRVAVSRQAD